MVAAATLGLAVIAWLLYGHPAEAMDDSVPFNAGDPALILWTLRWSGHALFTRHLFDAPIFWPSGNTLAFADPLVAPAPVQRAIDFVLPGGPLVAFNVLIISTLVGNVWATFLLARRVLVDSRAAAFAALAFSFSAMTLGWVGHPQLLPVGLFAVAFHLLLRLLDEARLRFGVWFAVVVSATFSTSLYHGAILAFCAGAMAVVWLAARRFRLPRATWRTLIVSAAITGALLAPIVWPYVKAKRDLNLSRPLVPAFGLNPRDLLTPLPNSTWYSWLDAHASNPSSEHTYFPGLLPTLLGCVGVVALALLALRQYRMRPLNASTITSNVDALGAGAGVLHADDPRGGPRVNELGLLAVAGAVSFVLSLGSEVHGVSMPFAFVHDHVPGFDGIRVASRLVAPAMLVGALFAGLGLRSLLDRLTSARLGYVLSAVACVIVLLEFQAPTPRGKIDESDATLAVYRELKHEPAGAVIELPMGDPRLGGGDWAYTETPRMLYATIDWKPRLNGYSGYWPATYLDDIDVSRTFPGPASLDRLRERHVRYVVLHTAGTGAMLPATAAAIVAALPSTVTAAPFGSSWLIDLERH